jgi:hypothetical protein
MIFDKYIFQENGKFFMDLTEFHDNIGVEIGDYIKFTYDGQKILCKVVNKINNTFELYLLEFII